MALQTYIGSGTAKTTTGTQSYTGVGFTPKAVIFFNAGEATADGNITNGAHILGATDGTNDRALGWAGETRTATDETSTNYSNTLCLIFGNESRVSAAWQTRTSASISSFDADGFTLNFGVANGTAYKFNYIAIGGAGISASVGTVVEGTTTGNFSSTTPSFQPSFLMLLFGNTTFGTSTAIFGGIGFATSSSNRGFTFNRSQQTLASPSQAARLRTTKLYETTQANSDTVITDGDFVSFDSTGFTINRLTDDGNDKNLVYIAIKGVSANVKQISSRTTNGSDIQTGVGFKASFMMLNSHIATTASSRATGIKCQGMFGAAIDSTHRAVSGHVHKNNAANDQDSSAYTDTANVITGQDPTTPTNLIVADFTSMDSDGFTTNYTTTDGNAYLILAISLKDNTGIAFDAASNSGYQAAASSYTWSHTCTGSNGYLVVGIAMLSLAQTVTSITYNSVALSLIGVRASITGAARVELWGLVAPTTGTNTISVSLSGSIASAGCASSYTGVNQSTSFESFNSAQATNVGAADATVDVTTIADNDWCVDIVATDDTAITAGAGQTEAGNVTGAGGSGAMSYEGPKTPAGAVTMSWTNVGALATWAIASVALRDFNATSSTGASNDLLSFIFFG